MRTQKTQEEWMREALGEIAAVCGMDFYPELALAIVHAVGHLRDRAEKAEADLAALRARTEKLARLEALVSRREVQWRGWEGCIVCGVRDAAFGGPGHAPDCELAAALGP